MPRVKSRKRSAVRRRLGGSATQWEKRREKATAQIRAWTRKLNLARTKLRTWEKEELLAQRKITELENRPVEKLPPEEFAAMMRKQREDSNG